jgi:hypothetical protein
MYAVRQWSVRNARALEWLYNKFATTLLSLHPLFERIGYGRLEAPMAGLERHIKGFMFDCQMCGTCTLRATGMSCPMNCPKTLRNGPCGGVRPNGNCEVKPEMRCVWAEAWSGAQRMRNGRIITDIQAPVDNQYRDTSSWLRVTRAGSLVVGSDADGAA